MRLVVTGALGHIGSKLVRELPRELAGCDEIVLVDDLSTQRYASLFDLPAGTRYRFFEADVASADLRGICDGAAAVVHLAAITDAASSFDQRERVMAVNFQAVQRVAETCAAVGAPLVFPSTTSVYGTQAEQVDEACREDELRPQSPYAEAKLAAERWLSEFAGGAALRHVTLRLGTIFGVSPGMRFHTAVNRFAWQAVLGQPLSVWRTALDQARPYLDLDDAIRGVAFFLRSGRFDGETYNVLTLNATVREILDALRAHVPDLKVELVESRIMNQLSYRVSDAKLRSLRFEPRGDLGRALGQTVDLLRGVRA
jgi:nucleoside-diphosphate-sugar epimerase